MFFHTRDALEKIAISGEELAHVAHLTKQKYRVPKSLAVDTPIGPVMGGVPEKVRRPTLRFAQAVGIAKPGTTMRQLERAQYPQVGLSRDATAALTGKRRVILPGPRGAAGNKLISQLQEATGKKQRKFSGKEKALLSRLMWAHEGAEHAAKRHVPGLAGHANPGVLVKETNILNTLTGVDPKAKKTAREFLGTIRKGEPMTRVRYTVAGSPFEWTYGKGAKNLQTGEVLPRVSRHHRKAINRSAEKLMGGTIKDPKTSVSQRRDAVQRIMMGTRAQAPKSAYPVASKPKSSLPKLAPKLKKPAPIKAPAPTATPKILPKAAPKAVGTVAKAAPKGGTLGRFAARALRKLVFKA